MPKQLGPESNHHPNLSSQYFVFQEEEHKAEIEEEEGQKVIETISKPRKEKGEQKIISKPRKLGWQACMSCDYIITLQVIL